MAIDYPARCLGQTPGHAGIILLLARLLLPWRPALFPATLDINSQCIALINPQFELTKGDLNKRGIVRSDADGQKVIRKMQDFIAKTWQLESKITPP